MTDARATTPAAQPPPPPGGGADVPAHAPGHAPGPPPGPGTVFDDRERPLAPQVVTSWRIGTTVSMLIPAVVITSVLGLTLEGVAIWVAAGFAVLWSALLLLYHPARYRRWRWRLTDLAVELRYGVITRSQETVPYFRIQQIDIVQGPLDRLLHLSTLQVTTASATGRAALPGIAEDDAPGVRQELLARATAAVADHPGDLRDAV